MSNNSKRIENHEFFSHSSPEVAVNLLGKLLCREKEDGETVCLRITVTEAYGENDSACYGIDYKNGKYITQAPTPATAPLYEGGGVWCIYGGMLLLACGRKGIPENVLIREAGNEEHYCNGPFNLCKYLGIDKSLHGEDATTSDSLCLKDDGTAREYCITQRVRLGKDVRDEDRKRKNRFISL